MNVLKDVRRARRLAGNAASVAFWQRSIGTIRRRLGLEQEPPFAELIADYDVIIMKHCFPSSDILPSKRSITISVV